ncbi:unnamed protein product [Brassicogethes aeneus]|uniref:Uncharacterized protein n=1 Tax=Brassicogethes aeneus TaxID=1431903 RepID=A0A9P0FJ00_BRAAE|nr:unnamed protein product [Brassicogethes aeneus]
MDTADTEASRKSNDPNLVEPKIYEQLIESIEISSHSEAANIAQEQVECISEIVCLEDTPVYKKDDSLANRTARTYKAKKSPEKDLHEVDISNGFKPDVQVNLKTYSKKKSLPFESFGLPDDDPIVPSTSKVINSDYCELSLNLDILGEPVLGKPWDFNSFNIGDSFIFYSEDIRFKGNVDNITKKIKRAKSALSLFNESSLLDLSALSPEKEQLNNVFISTPDTRNMKRPLKNFNGVKPLVPNAFNKVELKNKNSSPKIDNNVIEISSDESNFQSSMQDLKKFQFKKVEASDRKVKNRQRKTKSMGDIFDNSQSNCVQPNNNSISTIKLRSKSKDKGDKNVITKKNNGKINTANDSTKQIEKPVIRTKGRSRSKKTSIEDKTKDITIGDSSKINPKPPELTTDINEKTRTKTIRELKKKNYVADNLILNRRALRSSDSIPFVNEIESISPIPKAKNKNISLKDQSYIEEIANDLLESTKTLEAQEKSDIFFVEDEDVVFTISNSKKSSFLSKSQECIASLTINEDKSLLSETKPRIRGRLKKKSSFLSKSQECIAYLPRNEDKISLSETKPRKRGRPRKKSSFLSKSQECIASLPGNEDKSSLSETKPRSRGRPRKKRKTIEPINIELFPTPRKNRSLSLDSEAPAKNRSTPQQINLLEDLKLKGGSSFGQENTSNEMPRRSLRSFHVPESIEKMEIEPSEEAPCIKTNNEEILDKNVKNINDLLSQNGITSEIRIILKQFGDLEKTDTENNSVDEVFKSAVANSCIPTDNVDLSTKKSKNIGKHVNKSDTRKSLRSSKSFLSSKRNTLEAKEISSEISVNVEEAMSSKSSQQVLEINKEPIITKEVQEPKTIKGDPKNPVSNETPLKTLEKRKSRSKSVKSLKETSVNESSEEKSRNTKTVKSSEDSELKNNEETILTDKVQEPKTNGADSNDTLSKTLEKRNSRSKSVKSLKKTSVNESSDEKSKDTKTVKSSEDSELKNNEETILTDKVQEPQTNGGDSKNRVSNETSSKTLEKRKSRSKSVTKTVKSSKNSELKNNEEPILTKEVQEPKTIEGDSKIRISNETPSKTLEKRKSRSKSRKSLSESSVNESSEEKSKDTETVKSSENSELKNNEPMLTKEIQEPKTSISNKTPTKTSEKRKSRSKSVKSLNETSVNESSEQKSEKTKTVKSSVNSELKNKEEPISTEKVDEPKTIGGDSKNRVSNETPSKSLEKRKSTSTSVKSLDETKVNETEQKSKDLKTVKSSANSEITERRRSSRISKGSESEVSENESITEKMPPPLEKIKPKKSRKKPKIEINQDSDSETFENFTSKNVVTPDLQHSNSIESPTEASTVKQIKDQPKTSEDKAIIKECEIKIIQSPLKQLKEFHDKCANNKATLKIFSDLECKKNILDFKDVKRVNKEEQTLVAEASCLDDISTKPTKESIGLEKAIVESEKLEIPENLDMEVSQSSENPEISAGEEVTQTEISNIVEVSKSTEIINNASPETMAQENEGPELKKRRSTRVLKNLENEVINITENVEKDNLPKTITSSEAEVHKCTQIETPENLTINDDTDHSKLKTSEVIESTEIINNASSEKVCQENEGPELKKRRSTRVLKNLENEVINITENVEKDKLPKTITSSEAELHKCTEIETPENLTIDDDTGHSKLNGKLETSEDSLKENCEEKQDEIQKDLVKKSPRKNCLSPNKVENRRSPRVTRNPKEDVGNKMAKQFLDFGRENETINGIVPNKIDRLDKTTDSKLESAENIQTGQISSESDAFSKNTNTKDLNAENCSVTSSSTNGNTPKKLETEDLNVVDKNCTITSSPKHLEKGESACVIKSPCKGNFKVIYNKTQTVQVSFESTSTSETANLKSPESKKLTPKKANTAQVSLDSGASYENEISKLKRTYNVLITRSPDKRKTSKNLEGKAQIEQVSLESTASSKTENLLENEAETQISLKSTKDKRKTSKNLEEKSQIEQVFSESTASSKTSNLQSQEQIPLENEVESQISSKSTKDKNEIVSESSQTEVEVDSENASLPEVEPVKIPEVDFELETPVNVVHTDDNAAKKNTVEMISKTSLKEQNTSEEAVIVNGAKTINTTLVKSINENKVCQTMVVNIEQADLSPTKKSQTDETINTETVVIEDEETEPTKEKPNEIVEIREDPVIVIEDTEPSVANESEDETLLENETIEIDSDEENAPLLDRLKQRKLISSGSETASKSQLKIQKILRLSISTEYEVIKDGVAVSVKDSDDKSTVGISDDESIKEEICTDSESEESTTHRRKSLRSRASNSINYAENRSNKSSADLSKTKTFKKPLKLDFTTEPIADKMKTNIEEEVKEEEILESPDINIEDTNFELGDIVWSRIGTCPFWPSLVTTEPDSGDFYRPCVTAKKISLYHVRFFGDKGRRAWIKNTHMVHFCSKNDLNFIAKKMKEKGKHNVEISQSCVVRNCWKQKWQTGVDEAKTVKSKSYQEKVDYFKKVVASMSAAKEKKEIQPNDDTLSVKSESSDTKSLKRKYEKIKRDSGAGKKESESPPRKKTKEDPDDEVFLPRLRHRRKASEDESSDTESKVSEVSVNVSAMSQQRALFNRNKLFKGVARDKVCQLCLKPDQVYRCKGKCYGSFHYQCAMDIAEGKVDVKKKAARRSNEEKKQVDSRKTNEEVINVEEPSTTPSDNPSTTGNDSTKTTDGGTKSPSGNVQIVTVRSHINNTPPKKNFPDNFKTMSLAEQIDFKMKEIMRKFEAKTVYKESSTDSSCDEREKATSLLNKSAATLPNKSADVVGVEKNGGAVEKEASKEALESEAAKAPETVEENKKVDEAANETSQKAESPSFIIQNALSKREKLRLARQRKNEKRRCKRRAESDFRKGIVRHVTADADLVSEEPESMDAKNFKCGFCAANLDPLCAICMKYASPGGSSVRQKCSLGYCGKYYHQECLKPWPQTQWTLTQTVLNNSVVDTFVCPIHACHTCVSDDPRMAHVHRCSSDKLVRCLSCPAAYHQSSMCLPAGTEILTGSQIVCPRHSKYNRKQQICNANWCFLCSRGGNLICCETCPMSIHPECITKKINPDEAFICEDCESGRYPLYDEIVWCKLGHYRWWPGVVLYPNEIPDNVLKINHDRGEFVVKFYGTYDHHWFNKGRVFLFHEGDKGQNSANKQGIDLRFQTAIEEATIAHRIKKEFKNSKDIKRQNLSKIPPYIKIKVNKPVGNVRQFDPNLSNTTPCECDPKAAQPCGPDSDCLNRLLLTECDADVCPAGTRCCNQCFEKKEYPPLTPARTSERGWGLKTLAPVKKGQFVIEYVGEMIDETEYQRRIKKMHECREENYYFLTIDKDRMLDAGPKGNVARFMNHSCQPNCETQKWTVNGDTRVGLFATEDIPANTELTFNYNLECVGKEKKVCMCGAPNCSGFIGVKAKSDIPSKKVKKYKLKKHLKATKPVNVVNKNPCFICGKKGLVEACNNKICTKSYHLKCVKLDAWPDGNKFICPWHNCKVCTKRTIRCCVQCINSYCPQHSEGNIRHDNLLGFICSDHDPTKCPQTFLPPPKVSKNPKILELTDESTVTSTTSEDEWQPTTKRRSKTKKAQKQRRESDEEPLANLIRAAARTNDENAVSSASPSERPSKRGRRLSSNESDRAPKKSRSRRSLAEADSDPNSKYL